jgi:flagellar M-ring protein FliF
MASIAAIVIFLLSFFAYLTTKVGTSDFTVLYSNLELEDSKQIVSRLETARVRFRLTKNGTEILVPSDMVSRLRVDTADLALGSSGSSVGYEIFDSSDALGSTNFVQNVNLVRALEGELARTIRVIDNVKSARVHLVLPKREMFSREERTPSASVVIRTVGGRLSPQSVQSIQKLVAASVPKLKVKDVAVVDSAGNLLTNNFDSDETRAASHNEMVRQEQERALALSIQNLLERTIGEGKVRAQVNLEMDFDHIVTNEEVFDPDGQVVRSQATVTEEGENSMMDRPVTVSQNIPNPDGFTHGGGGEMSRNMRTEETVNFEISRTVRNKVKSVGRIERLTVAVMVDGVNERDANGIMQYRDRTEAEMEQIRALVRTAVGFNARRGDVVEVKNMRFISLFDDEEAAKPFLLGFTKEEIIRIAEGLGVAIVAILVILLVIRPLIRNAFNAGARDGQLLGEGAEEDNLLLSNFLNEEDSDIDELISLNKIDGRIKVSSLKKINEIVQKSPETAVNIIRHWLYQSE